MQRQSPMHIEVTRCDMFPSALSQLTDVVYGILLKVTEQQNIGFHYSYINNHLITFIFFTEPSALTDDNYKSMDVEQQETKYPGWTQS